MCVSCLVYDVGGRLHTAALQTATQPPVMNSPFNVVSGTGKTGSSIVAGSHQFRWLARCKLSATLIGSGGATLCVCVPVCRQL